MHRKPSTSTLITAVMAVIGLLLLMAAPAVAGNHDQRSDGRSESGQNNSQNGQNNSEDRPEPRKSSSSKPQSKSTTTEDNDGDGRNNAGQADDGSDNTYPNASRHPSGKDRYLENGGSGNQGKSQSDPDGDSNGGVDKPGGDGGLDPYDQDGNNGCGNDQDFEDDNNGNCGGKGKQRTDEDDIEDADVVAIRECVDGSIVPVNEGCSKATTEIDTELDTVTIDLDHNLALRGAEDKVTKVLGIKIAREAAQPAAASRVLGLRLSPALSKSVVVAGAVLPFTGGELLVYLALALGLIGAGAVMMLRRRES